MTTPLDANKQVVRDFYDLAFNQHLPADAAARHVDGTYRQHNAGAGDGVGPFVALVTGFVTAFPKLHVTFKRLVAEGNLVVLHSHFVRQPGDRGSPLWTSSGWRAASLWSIGMCCRKFRRRPPTRIQCSDLAPVPAAASAQEDGIMNSRILALTTAVVILGVSHGCSDTKQEAELDTMNQLQQAHLTTFDDLDFNVFSGQKWDQLDKSHATDITVHWPDGRTTKGIDTHIEDLKGMFVYAPDTRIKEHPIKIASGEWTAVTGVMEGTFSQPMPTGNGKTIPATGKAFRLSMVTIGHWREGRMDEEWLFWDNQAFMKQIGLAP